MSNPTEPGWEHPETYFVQDRGNLHEMTRLAIQNKMLTAGMGGVLPELADPTVLRRVLDVGCGTGGWLIETALARRADNAPACCHLDFADREADAEAQAHR